MDAAISSENFSTPESTLQPESPLLAQHQNWFRSKLDALNATLFPGALEQAKGGKLGKELVFNIHTLNSTIGTLADNLDKVGGIDGLIRSGQDLVLYFQQKPEAITVENMAILLDSSEAKAFTLLALTTIVSVGITATENPGAIESLKRIFKKGDAKSDASTIE